MKGFKLLIRAGQGGNKVIKRPGQQQQQKVMSPGVPGRGMGAEQFEQRIIRIIITLNCIC